MKMKLVARKPILASVAAIVVSFVLFQNCNGLHVDERVGGVPSSSVFPPRSQITANAVSDETPLSAFPIAKSDRRAEYASPGYNYGYAPAIIYADKQYHAYFCSSGSGVNTPAPGGGFYNSWDHIRYTTSQDGNSWTTPKDIIQPLRMVKDPDRPGQLIDTALDLSACDPAIVQFPEVSTGQIYYYLFIGGYTKADAGVIFLARSTSPAGPWSRYTVKGWQSPQGDDSVTLYTQYDQARPIVFPRKRGLGEPIGNVYGAGQPSVIEKDGVLMMFYTDTTAGSNAILRSTTLDPLVWPAGEVVVAGLSSASVDVRYDDLNKQFLMYTIDSDFQKVANLMVRKSSDGVVWSAPTKLGRLPLYAHDLGVLANANGHLRRDARLNASKGGDLLVSYGVPFDLSPNYSDSNPAPYTWGFWDLYGSVISDGVVPVASEGSSPTPNAAIIPGGFFKWGTGIFFSNGGDAFCLLQSWDDYKALGGPDDTSSFPMRVSLDSKMRNDGVCKISR